MPNRKQQNNQIYCDFVGLGNFTILSVYNVTPSDFYFFWLRQHNFMEPDFKSHEKVNRYITCRLFNDENSRSTRKIAKI